MSTRNVAAIDLGAESGRVMLARFDGARASLEEVHRFPNRPVRVRGHLFWDVLDLWREILAGLRRARQLAGTLDSVGVDTWGVDYGLVDAQGLLMGLPYHYRDGRTDGHDGCAGSQHWPRGYLYHDGYTILAIQYAVSTGRACPAAARPA